MSAERSCSLTIWMRRERPSLSEVPDVVRLCSHVARSRCKVGNGVLAYSIIKSIDSSDILVSPSLTDEGMLPWFEEYLKRGGGKYADVIGYHFYVENGPPEDAVPLIENVRRIMGKYGLADKPLWNTESGWSKSKTFSSDEEAAAYVLRSYLLNWAYGVKRFYWYAWDNHNWVGLQMIENDDKTLTPAAKGYATVQRWLIGKKMISCDVDSQGTWECKLQSSRGDFATVLWNPMKEVVFDVPASWQVHRVEHVLDTLRRSRDVKKTEINFSPVLLEK